MIKRLTWFLGGLAAGAAGSGYAKKKIKAQASRLAPAHLAKSVAVKAKDKVHDVASAVREGREAMHDKEDELRAQIDGEAAAVDTQQVIVLENVRDLRPRLQGGAPRRKQRR